MIASSKKRKISQSQWCFAMAKVTFRTTNVAAPLGRLYNKKLNLVMSLVYCILLNLINIPKHCSFFNLL
ncbi:uncharacterized protein RHIMIDRAFT_34548 [Rhizopus microsporus ATCC 52813]|uniref:Uncharacterized protein n=1 Tax=Rhizopus microsporus ATCC 52813 TaxID=1340429 RepID=A0A2G4SPT4_RHIZD|nr:uncharacterized protein RHIMIDRAFT_34548 [Rhizopus microsporus ATCC 52813]PHZ10787.1 hypothetical protein RHIMIDRAFT_34548 [Rhizopus microsporus ATCC 52813]